jgi:hypothetical protein
MFSPLRRKRGGVPRRGEVVFPHTPYLRFNAT